MTQLTVRVGDEKEYTGDRAQDFINRTFGPVQLFLAAHIFGYDETATPFAISSDAEQKRLFDLLVDSADLDEAFGRAKDEHVRLTTLLAEKERVLWETTAALGSLAGVSGEDGRHATVQAAYEQMAGQRNLVFQKEAALMKAQEGLSAAKHSMLLVTEHAKQQGESWWLDHKHLDANKSAIEGMLYAAKLAKIALQAVPLGGTCPTCVQKISVERVQDLLRKGKNKEGILHRQQLDNLQYQGDLSTAEEALQAGVNAANVQLINVTSVVTMLETEVRYAKESLVKLSAIHAQADKEVAAWKATVQQERTRLDKLSACTQEEIRVIKEELGRVAFWKEGFGPRGIRAFRLDKITPWLNAVAKKYSDLLFGDGTALRYSTQTTTKAGGIRERFETALYATAGSKKPVRIRIALSAGQAMRRDIVHLFSMVALAERLGKRTVRLLIADEVFRTLDAAGIRSVMDILRDRASLGKETIWIVEHDDELCSMFDNTITVARQGNKSSVSIQTA